MTKKCVQCGKTFKLTESEIHFYESKGLSLPKRCEKCRKENKKQQAHKSSSGSNRSGQSTRRSPFIAVLAIIIAIIGFIFKGPDFFVNHEIGTQAPATEQIQSVTYNFRNEKYLVDHFDKHKDEFDYSNAQEYLKGANRVINDPNALHKLEAEDGDEVYYLEATNELVIVSTDGYLRTYFKPSDGIKYFNRT
nr:zinc-ribbon domain containing protein [uncultured Cellulosilyticum sp.]